MLQIWFLCLILALLTKIDLSSFNTSNVTTMASMFAIVFPYKALILSFLNLDCYKNAKLFYNCNSLQALI
jgi:surface protein